MWMAGLTLPFISLTFLLLALTSPGTWGVALVFWLSDWFNSPSVPLLLSTYVSPSLCLVYCAPRPFSVLQLAQQVSGIVMWNPVMQKWSNRISCLNVEIHKVYIGLLNTVEHREQKVMGVIRLSSRSQYIWTLFQAVKEKKNWRGWHLQQTMYNNPEMFTAKPTRRLPGTP